MTSLAYDSYLVGGSARKGTSDELEVRRAIRQMCGYITDDVKIANYHHVDIEAVVQVRTGIAQAKRKGAERTDVSHNATGADAGNPFAGEVSFNTMIRRGSEALLEAIVSARSIAA